MLPKEHLTQAALLSCLTRAACGSRLCCNHTLFLSLVLQNGKTTSMPPWAVLKKNWNVVFDIQNNKKSEQKRTHLCTPENCYSNWSITISQMLNTFFSVCVSVIRRKPDDPPESWKLRPLPTTSSLWETFFFRYKKCFSLFPCTIMKAITGDALHDVRNPYILHWYVSALKESIIPSIHLHLSHLTEGKHEAFKLAERFYGLMFYKMLNNKLSLSAVDFITVHFVYSVLQNKADWSRNVHLCASSLTVIESHEALNFKKLSLCKRSAGSVNPVQFCIVLKAKQWKHLRSV